MRRLLKWAAAFLWAAASLAPLFATAAQVIDDHGVRSQWDAPPRRVVSLLPSLTETVCALGACDRLVGVDDYSNWPPAVSTLPRLGGLEDAHVERILALRPDVVLLARSARVDERLRALGVRVIALEAMSMDDARRVIEQLGRLLGREARAAALWREIDAGMARVAASLPPAVRGLRVYFEVSAAPYAAGESSFIGQILARLGVANVVPASLGPFPKLNPEFVVRADPQMIMLNDRNAAGLRERPGWSGIEAVRKGHVCTFSPAEVDALARPGPRMVEAASIIAACLTGPTGVSRDRAS